MRRATAIAASTALGAAFAVSLTSVAFAADGRGYYMMGPHRRGGPFLMMLLLLAAVAALIVVLWRNRHPAQTSPGLGTPPAPSASPTLNAQAILADRLAHGEINPDDYRAAVAVLRETSTPA